MALDGLHCGFPRHTVGHPKSCARDPMLLDLAESTQHNSALVGGPPLGEIHAMQGETEELWRKYCERAIVEQDPERLLELVA